jgi:hypothetical protein
MHLLKQERAMDRQVVVDKVLDQIKDDVLDNDFTAIEELLKDVPLEQLIGYLPEGTISQQ